LLVVSAFPGDYTPTARSLIGALSARGVSVAELAADPEVDLRATTSCWVSRPLSGGRRFGFDRLLCYESWQPNTAAAAVGDIFRTLVPFVGPHIGIRDVAMPIVASGDQRVPRDQMIRAILTAATRWMEFGLPLDRLRIVVRDRDALNAVIAVFESFVSGVQRRGPVNPDGGERPGSVFLSYARADGRDVVDEIRSRLSAVAPEVQTLIDVVDIDVGACWQMRISELIKSSSKVVFVVTDGFWRSPVCLEEYNMALVLERDRGGGVVFPLYARSCELPLHFRILNYEDCREADTARVHRACDRLVETLRS
jgi:hypothetical protein